MKRQTMLISLGLLVALGCAWGCQQRQILSNEGYFPAGYRRTSVRFGYNYRTNILQITVACVPVKDVYDTNFSISELAGFSRAKVPQLPQGLKNNQQSDYYLKRDPNLTCYCKLSLTDPVTGEVATYSVTWEKGKNYPQVSAEGVQGSIIYIGNIFKNPRDDFPRQTPTQKARDRRARRPWQPGQL